MKFNSIKEYEEYLESKKPKEVEKEVKKPSPRPKKNTVKETK